MAPGADKRIFFDPPGALGLVDRTAAMLIRFDEIDAATRPRDATGVCEDFDVNVTPVATAMPPVVAATLGRGRLFNGASMGLATTDKDPGATLLTRDMSIQVVLTWDAAAQDAAGTPGTIVSRGLGGSAAERVCYGLRFDVVDAPSFTGLIRWYWQDVSGVEKLQDGAEVCMPPGQYTMITATRRWIGPAEVELRYYVGDQLIGSVTSADGSIGGGTTGTLQLGCRTSGGVNGAFLSGTLDELMLLGRELCAEEIEATWLRITLYEPRGVRLFLDMIDEDFPIPDVPSSDAQLDIRMTGHSLGFAAAQAENLRANFLPQRAYGSTLEQWEQAVAVTPKPTLSQSIDERRARVLARLRQKQGISIPGLKDALEGLVDCDVDDLEFIAYDNTVIDNFATVDPVLWDMSPTGCATANAGKARMAPGAGNYVLSPSLRTWLTMARPVSQPVNVDEIDGVPQGGEVVTGKIVFTTPQNNVEVGIWTGDKAANNFMLLGLKQDGVFKVVAENYVSATSGGLVTEQTLGANPAAIWLRLRQDPDTGGWIPSWSVVSGTEGFTVGATIDQPAKVHWAGFYLRGAAGAGPVVDFDEFVLWTPSGTRPFNAYVFRDPGLGGQPDLAAAHSVIAEIRHAFTHATIITSRALLCDNPSSGCDRGPMGAL